MTKTIDLGNLIIPIIKPVKGVDYFTSQEQQEMENNVFDRLNPRVEEAETIRQANEAIRVEAETQRSLQEQSRQSKESTRQNNENARIEAEELRQQNEAERAEAEQTRSQTFTNQMGAVDTAIEGIHTSQEAYDQNATAKTTAFNQNATAKTTEFNSNANEKLNAYNQNASQKIAEYDTHVHDYEAELANKVDKVQGKGLSTNDYDDTEKGKVQANTEARHTHSNKSILDGTTASYTTEKDEKLDKLENYDDSELREEIDQNSTDIENVEKRVDLLEDIQSMEELSWKQIQAIVQAGKASTYFKIGDQIITKWKDTYANKEYEVPLDVVSFEDVTISDNGTEKIVPGMVLQWHYCSPFGVQFSQNQAFYHCNEPLPAGKYYFTIGDNWGSHCHKDYKYEFETTQTIPAGGQILIGTASSETSDMPDNNPSNWRIRTYSSPDSTTPLEILTLTKNDTPTGTFLGTLSTSTKYNTTLNNLYSSAYGHNRWKNSALRQYLNSAEDAGNWFVLPDDVFARKPDQLSNKNGFLSGVDSELLSVIKAVKVSTAINTNRDSEIGTWDYTYDKFFLPSMEQVYCNPQITGEGKYWEYWKIKSGLSSPNAQWSTNPNMITYAVENHSSAQYVRLRSASRGYSYNAWNVGASGGIDDDGYATFADRFSPACVIC